MSASTSARPNGALREPERSRPQRTLRARWTDPLRGLGSFRPGDRRILERGLAVSLLAHGLLAGALVSYALLGGGDPEPPPTPAPRNVQAIQPVVVDLERIALRTDPAAADEPAGLPEPSADVASETSQPAAVPPPAEPLPAPEPEPEPDPVPEPEPEPDPVPEPERDPVPEPEPEPEPLTEPEPDPPTEPEHRPVAPAVADAEAPADPKPKEPEPEQVAAADVPATTGSAEQGGAARGGGGEAGGEPAEAPGGEGSEGRAGRQADVDRDGLLRAYLGTVNRVVRRGHSYPRAARRIGLEGTVMVILTIAEDGRIVRVEVDESSGHEVLDRAALDQVRRLDKLPPPPQALRWGERSLRLPVRYTLPS